MTPRDQTRAARKAQSVICQSVIYLSARRRGVALASSIVALLGLGLGAVPAASASEGSWEVVGFGAVRAVGHDAPRSFRDRGVGRLDWGDGDARVDATGELHLALEGTFGATYGVFLHALARAEPSELEGDAIGVVEAYGHARWPFARGLVDARLGHFLLPTSRENVDVAWSSPYTLSLSAINTWIAEEVRVTGVSTEVTLDLLRERGLDQIVVGGTVFGGNDASGALLAWRGWSLGPRLVVLGEVVPLPPLESLADDGGFAPQRDDGTRPFGDDLDGRAGWAASAGWRRLDRAEIVVTRYDNRGDLDLHGDPGAGEYAWDTDFWLVGAELRLGRLDLLGEWMDGTTRMGTLRGTLGDAKVRAGFRAAYVLASWRGDGWRLSLRRDDFATTERDFTTRGEINDEDGDAWTFAAFWEPRERPLRLGLEWLTVDAERAETPRSDGETLSLELRWLF